MPFYFRPSRNSGEERGETQNAIGVSSFGPGLRGAAPENSRCARWPALNPCHRCHPPVPKGQYFLSLRRRWGGISPRFTLYRSTKAVTWSLNQGKARSSAALGCVPQDIPSPGRAKQSGNANSESLEFNGINRQAGLPSIQRVWACQNRAKNMLERRRPRPLSSHRWTPPVTTTSKALSARSTWTTCSTSSRTTSKGKPPSRTHQDEQPILHQQRVVLQKVEADKKLVLMGVFGNHYVEPALWETQFQIKRKGVCQ